MSQCDVGYQGPICQTCIIHDGITYSKGTGKICTQCMEKSALYAYVVAIFLLFIIFFIVFLGFFIIFSVNIFLRYNIKSLFLEYNTENKDVLISECWGSAYMKIFLNYLQLLSISNEVSLNWSETLSGLFTSQQIFSGSVIQILSLECLVGGFFFS